jgi:hypothetical protein
LLLLLVQPSDVIGYQAAPGFNSAVILFGLDVLSMRAIQPAGIGGIEPQLDGVGQAGLIIFHTYT